MQLRKLNDKRENNRKSTNNKFFLRYWHIINCGELQKNFYNRKKWH